MDKIKIIVRIGPGAWQLSKIVRLVGCPHVGDQIVVGDDVIQCEVVRIWSDHVEVVAPHEPVNPSTEGHYLKDGWSRG